MAKMTFCFCTSLVAVLAGCGGGGDATPKVNLDPAAVASRIMAEYDTDGNGEISKAELKKCPGLAQLTTGQENMSPAYRLDQDESNTISEAEFVAKFTACFEEMWQPFSCTVKRKRKPLAGATVTLVPESFMGDIPVPSGETDEDGFCEMSSDGYPAVVAAIYRVEITHPDEKISAKFNTESKIGLALDPTNPYGQMSRPLEYNVK